MKCEHCGNNLSIEDVVCPYCGKKNKFAEKHIKDMDKYEEDYESVKKEVLSNSRRFNGFTARLTIIAVLIALIASVFVAYGRRYDIKNSREQRIILSHLDKHRAAIEQLMEERDYQGLYYYFQTNNLSYSGPLDEYHLAYEASEKYVSLMDYIFYLHQPDSYYTTDEAVERIANIIDRLTEEREPRSDYDRKKYYTNDDVVAYMNDVADYSELIIRGYFGFSEEDMKTFKGLNKARKQLMLEEAWENES
ncbi:MAG: zinc ribbon domain-containing protein [Lachnospiraceae bacterium]|nr:zinc ribbon domain-containing protein [Lachnospiraceae bacterium]